MARPTPRRAGLWADCRCSLAESPRWDDRTNQLLWVDLDAGDLWMARTDRTAAPDGGPVRVQFDRPASVAVPRTDGGLLTAGPGGFVWTDRDGRPGRTVDLPEDWSVMRMNDGACDPVGRLLCGSTSREAGAWPGRLYQLDGDGRVRVLLDGLGMSNGIAWSPTGDTVYHVDSLAHEVAAYSYDVDTGSLGDRRRFLVLEEDFGMPDGLTVDAEGFLWVAVWGAGRVLRCAPDGEVVSHIDVPARYVTACTFGGDGLSDLYITTARRPSTGHPPRAEPAAGGVFRCAPGTSGLPLSRFAG
ncbi:SMP-30/gluconolactonase/LRE family protein [Streptomyces asiaticus]